MRVTSLITNPNADPHLFETSAADAATLAQAQVVVENGAGYDTWMQSLLSADSTLTSTRTWTCARSTRGSTSTTICGLS